MTRAGLATVNFTTIGVYTYKVSDVGDSFGAGSVIVNPGPKVRIFRDREKETERERQIERERDRQTDRQTDRETERDRQTESVCVAGVG